MTARHCKLFRPLAENLEKRELLTVTTTMLADFSSSGATEISGIQSVGDLLYFDVEDSGLWRTDGTPSGTLKLADVQRSRDLLDAGDFQLFNGPLDSPSIWRTDGTKQGTFELVPGETLDYHNWTGEVLTQVVQVGEEIFFSDFSVDSSRIYQSDGTTGGTSIVTEDYRSSLVATSNAVFYVNESQTISVMNVGSDTGVAEPRELVLPFPNDSFEPQDPSTTDSPTLLIEPREQPQLYTINNKLVFATSWDSEANPRDVEVIAWSSDGTEEGTHSIAREVGLRNEVDGLCCSDWAQVGNKVVFPFASSRFLSTDGTTENTQVFPYTGRQNSRYLGELEGRAYFGFFFLSLLDSPHPIYSTDGDSFRLEVPSRFTEGRIEGDTFVVHLGGLDFEAPNLSFVRDEAGWANLRTPAIKDLAFPQTANVGSTWYFQGEQFPLSDRVSGRMDIDSGYLGTDLPHFGRFLSHSTTITTTEPPPQLQRHGWAWPTGYPKPSDAPLFAQEGEALYALDGGFSRELITDLAGQLQYQYDADGFFYFTNTTAEFGNEVWVSDGTAEGTTVIDLHAGPDSSEPTLYNWDGKTLITASNPQNGTKLWLINVDDLRPDRAILDTPDYSIEFGNELSLQANVQGADEEFLYAWDLDGDGTFEVESSEPTANLSWTEVTELAPSIGQGLHDLTVLAVGQVSGEKLSDSGILHVHDGRKVERFSSLNMFDGRQPPPNDLAMHVSESDGMVEVELSASENSDVQYSLSVTRPDDTRSHEINGTPIFLLELTEVGWYSLTGIARVAGQRSGTSEQTRFYFSPEGRIDENIRFPDIDGNRRVDHIEFFTLSRNYGRVDAAFADGDFNGDNKVDFADFLLLSHSFDR